MTVNKLKDRWEVAISEEDKSDVINQIKIKTYVPFATKKKAVDALVDLTIIEVDGFKTFDSMDRWINYVMTAVVVYTDLELSSDNNELLEQIDFLMESGAWTAINEKASNDLQDFLSFFNVRMDDKLRENSVEYSLAKGMNTLNTKLEEMIKDFDFDSMREATIALKGFANGK
ncbi:MAG: hypothetical protein [Bacteriophage sp.]|nr:MAG: hypothetical protein [Bacteriophage sp.]